MKVSALPCAALLTAALLAGCSSGSGTGSGGGGNADDAAVQSALQAGQQRVDEVTAQPTDVGVDQPLGASPEQGLHYVNISNPFPVSEVNSDGMAAAAEALGWQYTNIIIAPGAEGLQQAFDSAFALADPPDFIQVSGPPKQIYAAQLSEAQSRGIPVIGVSVADPAATGDGIEAVLNGLDAQVPPAEAVIADIAVRSEGTAQILVVNVPEVPVIQGYVDAVQSGLEQFCPNCTTTSVDVATTDIGTAAPQKIVSALQRAPGTSYVVFPFGDLSTGVDAALSAAGLSDSVTLAGFAPSQANLQALRDGSDEIWAGLPTALLGWRSIDAAARISLGEEVVDTPMPTQLLTKDTIGDAYLADTGYFEAVPDYESVFRQLWNVG